MNVALTWKAPKVRTDGTPLLPSEIGGYKVELSADGGQNFGTIGTTTTPDTAFTQTELESGGWVFGITPFDTRSLAGPRTLLTVTIP